MGIKDAFFCDFLYNTFMTSVVLMATLGSKPQLITLALDCLHAQGIQPGEVIVFHTWRERPETAQALKCLEEDTRRAPSTPPYRFLELGSPDGVLRDVTAPSELEAAFRSMFAEVRAAKFAEKSVHLLIAGGRRTLAVFGMAVAQMLFDDTDHLWHLASHPDLEASRCLHAASGEWARLIPIPVIPWGRLSPVFDLLRSVEDPLAAAESLIRYRMREQWDAARIFILSQLTPAERAVIELLAGAGLSQGEISRRLNLSPRTVEQHLRSVYRKAADHWELEHVNQTQLVRLLSVYFTALPVVAK
jgi:CRISPR-associated protein Csx14